MAQERIKNVPDNQVIAVVDEFQDAGATKIVMNKQPNGQWTVAATLPDEQE